MRVEKQNRCDYRECVLQYTFTERPVLDRARKHFKTADGTTLNIAGTTNMMISLGPVIE